MELKDLLYFTKVVEAGGVTSAAKALHRVPSGVSIRIQNLEFAMKTQLFFRDKKQMILTPAGKILLEYAHKLLSLADEATHAVQMDSPKGVLKLGSMESTAATRLPLLISSLQERYPKLSLSLTVDDPIQLSQQVLSGDLDAALVPQIPANPRLRFKTAYTEKLVLIGPHGHKPIESGSDIGNLSLLAFDPDCPFRNRLLDWYGQAESKAPHVMDLGSYSTILGCCAAGIGIALVPLKVVEAYLRKFELSVHPLEGSHSSINIDLIWRADIVNNNLAALSDVVSEQYLREVVQLSP